MKLLAMALLVALPMVAGWSIERAYAEPTSYYQDQKVVYHNDGGPQRTPHILCGC